MIHAGLPEASGHRTGRVKTRYVTRLMRTQRISKKAHESLSDWRGHVSHLSQTWLVHVILPSKML